MKIADDIIAAVCAEHGIAAEQLLQKGMQTKAIANARGDAIDRLRKQHFSANWIATFLNMTRGGVNRYFYPKVRESQKRAKERSLARTRAARAEMMA